MMRIFIGSCLVVLLASPLVSPSDAPPPFLLMWGSAGSEIGQFEGNKPRALDLDRYGNVYIVDRRLTPTNINRVQVFDSEGRFVRHFLEAYSDGGIEGITLDNQGNIFLINSWCCRVEKYDNSGNFLRMWGWGVQDGAHEFQICTSGCQCGGVGTGDGQLYWPQGAGTDADGNVYVADRENERVVKYDNQGNFLRMWGWGVRNGAAEFQICTSGCEGGITGSGNGQFSLPTEIAVLGDTVYVSDWSNNRVQLFSRNGTFKKKIGVSQQAAGVDVSPSGDIYVVVYFADEIVQFDNTGSEIARWGATGSGIGQFDYPYGVAVSPNGDVFITDSDNHRVQKFGPALDFFIGEPELVPR